MAKPRRVAFLLPKRCAVCNKKLVFKAGSHFHSYIRNRTCGPRCAAISRSRTKTAFASKRKRCKVCGRLMQPDPALCAPSMDTAVHNARKQFMKRLTCSEDCRKVWHAKQVKISCRRRGAVRISAKRFAKRNNLGIEAAKTLLGVRHG